MKIFLKLVIILIIISASVAGITYVSYNYFGEPTFVKVRSIEISNIYRDCTIDSNGNYRDTTIQTTVDVNVKSNRKFSEPIREDLGCTLHIGANEIIGFSLNPIPIPEPFVQGIASSGLYMITGGELRGEKSDTLTFCCQDICVVGNIEVCNNAIEFLRRY
ncbi:MAG: hypothetical protein QF741_00730 [Candidatus Peribacteraceae bacterium]|jgi:hypothetical protein|nr:hypothetical protein [Candidatus Peribacteraceae bacterium]MDP7454295.1 hypothetical protein [Candidatus Peribacteraceae bacterium]MDP7645665.1 hypothetical protein [Candidatus Peribacteraceae bacterium]